MKHRHKEHKAKGGTVEPKGEKAKEHLYNAVGSPEAGEAKDEKDEFKRGGKHKRGGHVHGMKAAHRLDKRARGGRMSSGGGKSPFTEGHKASEPARQNTGKGSGHEDEGPSDSV